MPYAPESQAIFESIGGHPAALLTAAIELAAAALILIPRTVALGAAISALAMIGAIATHLIFIGVAVEFPAANPESLPESDGGTLFIMATATLSISLVLLWMHRNQIKLPGTDSNDSASTLNPGANPGIGAQGSASLVSRE